MIDRSTLQKKWQRMLKKETGRADAPSDADVSTDIERENTEAFLAAIIESSDDAIISKNLDSIITSWNRAAERMFGHRAKEAIGQSIYMLIPPDRYSEEAGILSRLKRGERIEHFETVRLRKDGTRIDVSLTISPIKNGDGRVIGASKIARDITDRLEAEKALATERQRTEESEKLFRAFVIASSDVVYRMSADWTEMRRLEGKDFIATTHDPSRSWMLKYIHPDDRAHVLAAINEAIRDKKIFELEHRVIRVDGTLGWTFSRAIPLLDDDGEIVEWFGAAHDITKRKIAEEARRESEERFRTMADNISQLAWMADEKGWIFWYNKRWFDYTGTTLEEMQGWGWQRVHHPEHVERVLKKIRHTFETGEYWEDTFPLRGKDGGYRWFLSRAVPIRDERGKVLRWFGTNTDVTEQRQTQKALEEARAQLARRAADLESAVAERTASLQETIFHLESFSYSITHDMRGPLRAISGFAHLLEQEHGKQLDEDARDLLRRMRSAATRLDRLIQDVLNYSRITREEMPMETVSLRTLIEDIATQYPDIKQHPENIEIACVDDRVRANLAALTQCISNLLSNAVKFVAPGQTPRVRVFCEERGPNTRLWVEDNGIGIPPEEQNQIFGVFHRLHGPGEYSGTGIGLAIVKRAVERMNGNVGVESEPGRGSRFWIELPRAENGKTVSHEKKPV